MTSLQPLLICDLKRDSAAYQFMGRRRGKKLRAKRAELLQTLLPKLEIKKPDHQRVGSDPAQYFESSFDRYILEIGFGSGDHLAHMARQNPKCGFIGAEPFINGVSTLLKQIDPNTMDNIRIYMDDVVPFLGGLKPQCLDEVYILFPDPWPKKRHHHRRIIQPQFLELLSTCMKTDARVYMATDHQDYLAWCLAHFLSHPAFEWVVDHPNHVTSRHPQSIPTRYEQKALDKGMPCFFLEFKCVL